MNFEQCAFGYLISKEGKIQSKKMDCIQKSSNFPTELIPECHPIRYGVGLKDGKDWESFGWKQKGGFSVQHHQIGEKRWMLFSNFSAVPVHQKSGKQFVLQSHSIAAEGPLNPLLLPLIAQELRVVPISKGNSTISNISVKPKDGRLPAKWIDRVTPFLQCILSGAPISWEDRKIPMENVLETIQLVCLSLPSSMMGHISLTFQGYTLYGDVMLAHGQHARKGVFFMKGSLLGAKKAGVQDCAQYLAKLRSFKPKSKKHLQSLITKVFLDLPPSFSQLPWQEQGPILSYRLSEKDTLAHIKSVVPKEPSAKLVLSVRGMRSEVLSLLLKHKKQPWAFPLLEKTISWKGAWLDHGVYGMILGAIHPESVEMFRKFVHTKIPPNLEEKTSLTISSWLEKIQPEIWKEMVSVSGESWWETWKQKNEISLFWCSLDPKELDSWDHTLYRRLIKKEWSRKAIAKLVSGCPSTLESVYCTLIDKLLRILPIQGLRLLEEGRKFGYNHPILWDRLHSSSLYMWKRGPVLQRQIGESTEELTELEVRIVLTFLEEKFARVDEIAPYLGAIAMQYFFGPLKLMSKKWASIAERVIKERMLWNPDAYFVHIGIPGIQELYLESINESNVLPAGGTGALLWMLLKGQSIDDSISLPEGFIELCTLMSYPIALSQVDSAAVLYALVINRNTHQRAACTKEQVQRMLLWYVQSKRVDAPLQWTSEPIWRLFPFLHDHENNDKSLKKEEIDFLQSAHPSLLRKFGTLGLLMTKEHLSQIRFRPNHRFSNVRTFTYIIVEAKAKEAAIQLGSSLWMRLSEDNREKLQSRIRLKTAWWRRILRFVLRTKTEVKDLKRRSEVLEALCMEFNCLGEIVLAAQNVSGNEAADI